MKMKATYFLSNAARILPALFVSSFVFQTQNVNAKPIDQISLGESHSCAVFKDTTIKCWGQNRSGQLGLGHTSTVGDSQGEMIELTQISLGSIPIQKVSTGGLHSCGLFENGKVKCWGNNRFGQLGLEDSENRGDQPGEMGSDLPFLNLGEGNNVSVLELSLGEQFTCARFSNHKVKCWGRNSSGQLGIESTNSRGNNAGEMGSNLREVRLGTNEEIKQIASGAMHSCALFTSGKIKCWGKGKFGQLGNNSRNNIGDLPNSMGNRLAFLDFGSDETFNRISLGFVHSCGMTSEGSIKCWGYNKDGRLGVGDTTNRGDSLENAITELSPIELAPSYYIETFSCGSRHCCARLENRALKCWGRNHQGGLGLGDTMTRSTEPNQMGDELPFINLGNLIEAEQMSLGGGHSCVIVGNGKLKCWGDNRFGQLGLENTNNHGGRPSTMGSRLPMVKI